MGETQTQVRTPSTLAVIGALVRRDLLRDLRKTRAFLLLVAAVLLMSLAAFASWPDESLTLSSVARQAEMMIVIFSFFWLVAACIVLPAYGAMAIVQEREQNTLELLDLTLMPRWALLVGKLLNTLGFYLFLIVAGLPALSLIFGLVGLDLTVFFKTLLILFPTALSVAMLSILCSTRCQRGIVALLLSYLAMLFAMGAWLIPVAWVMAVVEYYFDTGPGFRFIQDTGPILSPLVTMMYLANAMGSSRGFLLSSAYQTALFALAFLAAWAMLRRPLEAKVPRKSSTRRRPLTRMLDILFARVPPFRPIADRANPMYRAEVQWSPLTRPSGRRRLFLLLALVLVPVVLLFYFLLALEPDSNDIVMVWIMVHLTLISLLSPIMSANTITRESELGNLDMLRMTLLKPRDIVCGKLHAGFKGVQPILTVTMVSSLAVFPAVHGVEQGTEVFLTGLLTVVVCAALLVSFGVLASAVVKRSTTAVVLAYASSMTYIYLLMPGWFGAVDVLKNIAREYNIRIDTRIDEGAVSEILEGLSPVYAFWELFAGRDPHSELMAQWMASMVANGFLCFLLVALAVWFFERRRMREE
jgi:ABC-type transport system involved in multi-copper enzyme maturation permease subunit